MRRRQVKRVCFYCYLHLNLDCHIFTFINTETGISLLLLCNFAACLPKTDVPHNHNTGKVKPAAVTEMLQMVTGMQKQVEEKRKEGLFPPKDIPELRLYTPEQISNDCFETALTCFIQELNVLRFEFALESYELRNMNRMNRNAKAFSKLKQKNCKMCETFQEKNATHFLMAFENLLQNKYRQT
ncbi:interleukin-15-like isoform X1 [Stegostoma tigrinum]|uniref:interleukin-15-like isoform X1 n=1 Tax=Stegostoma tigrinum TaxID=3053191 RepID=UPI00202B15D9|nr:interleukin-15-like isoform X1 [Stegostoma tigrinum]XP_048394774.1 interleukin-15-like isoform X1 [Stegostoma tigrinum]XP_048394785.1 interleukin-15-like isoform X1 [Stegostoma tigrinum]